ncbi:MAG: hypothetical protein AAF196_19110 [Planctomycetota bacterium]
MDCKTAQAVEEAWAPLRPLGEAIAPYLLAAYPRTRSRQGRTALVFHSTRYARTSQATYELGLIALADRSFMVRYRACGVLAYSLRRDALPHLQPLASHVDPRTAEDAEAAISAIQGGNHHLFVDRHRTGQVHWIVNDSDRDAE